MSLKMKKILAVSAVAFILAVIIGIVIVVNNNDDDNAVEQIALAKQYYEMMDYDKSAAIYNQLLKSNSTEPDIYMGLYDVYMVMGKEEKAIEILQRGIENTNNKAIEEKLSQIYSELGYETDVSSEETSLISEEAEEVSVSEQIAETMLSETTTVPTVSSEQEILSEEETTASESITSATTTQIVTTTTRPTTTTQRITTTTTAPRPVTTTSVTTTPAATKTSTTKKNTEPVGEYEIRQHVITDYILTKDMADEMGIGSNTLIKVKASNAILYFNSNFF